MTALHGKQRSSEKPPSVDSDPDFVGYNRRVEHGGRG
jgi:hypothetical protein